MERTSHSYTVLSVLARTKYHVLYLVKDNVTGISYVIKTLNDTWQRDEKARDFLRNQAHVEKKLKHAHICETIDVLDRDNNIHVLREWMKGIDLRTMLESGAGFSDADLSIRWLKQMLKALIYAHAMGIYHGHISPDNIFVLDNGSVKLHGFSQSHNAWLRADLGKPQFHPLHYIAPEIYKGENCSNTSDIYSLGVIGYQLLTGRLPWHLDNNQEPLQQKPKSFTRPVIDPDLLGAKVPNWLYTVLNKALAVDPTRRFPSCSQMLQAIENETDVGYQPAQQIPIPITPSRPEPPRSIVPEPTDDKSSDNGGEVIPPETEPEEPTAETIQENRERGPEPQTKPSIQPSIREAEDKDNASAKLPIKPDISQKIIISTGKDEEGQELSKMKKKFVFLMILTLAITVFTAIKYFAGRQDTGFSPDRSVMHEQQDMLENLMPNELIAMVFVKGDSAVMGSMSPDADPDEFPLRQLNLKSFYISKFEITQRQWRMIFETNPSRFKDDDHPVENVSFYDAVEYCNQKSILDGLQPCYEIRDNEFFWNFDANGYRLPTEAEWEFAAKSGKRYVDEPYSGSNDPDQIGWYNLNSNAATNPAGSLNPNQLGIHDLSGNVYEWVWNWYARYSISTREFYSGPDTGTDKVIRGGSWYHDKHEMRITARNYAKPFIKTNYIGFRVVRNAK